MKRVEPLKEFWRRLFIGLDVEQRELVKLAPILLEASKEDADLVGALVWSHFTNNTEWKGTFRHTGAVLADIFNKRFGGKTFTYMDFYCANLRFITHTKKKMVSSYKDKLKEMQRKYNTKVCVNCT